MSARVHSEAFDLCPCKRGAVKTRAGCTVFLAELCWQFELAQPGKPLVIPAPSRSASVRTEVLPSTPLGVGLEEVMK